MTLRFRCPRLRVPIDTDLGTDFRTLRKNWSKAMAVWCPHCHDRHMFAFNAAYIEALLTEIQSPSSDAAHIAVRKGRRVSARTTPASRVKAPQMSGRHPSRSSRSAKSSSPAQEVRP